MFTKIFKNTLNAILLFLILIGSLVAFSMIPFPGNYKVFTVQSGSMEPRLHMGSLIFVKPETDYKIGDIITRKITDPKLTITHRISSKENKNGQPVYKTKGDANDASDAEDISQRSIIGKEILAIPFLGYPVSYAKTLPGLVILIILPAVIIIYDEIQNIMTEAVTLKQKRAASKTKAIIRKRKPVVGKNIDIRVRKVKYSLDVPVNLFKKYVATFTKKI